MKWSSIFGDKKATRIIYIILLFGGVLFVVGGMYHPKEAEKTPPAIEENTKTPDVAKELEALLGQIEGVGKVSVFVTYADGGETVYATDTRQNSDTREEQVVMGSQNGQSQPFPVQNVLPRVQGVIIVADGGDSVEVQNKLKEAVSAALGVYPHRVVVCGRK